MKHSKTNTKEQNPQSVGHTDDITNCPVCNSSKIEKSKYDVADFGEDTTMRRCEDCGSEFTIDGDVKLNAKTFEKEQVGHTPGKWIASEVDNNGGNIVSSEGWHIAKINPYAPEASNSKANARLIAAAPDLLKFIQSFKAHCFTWRTGNVIMDYNYWETLAESTLNKATKQ